MKGIKKWMSLALSALFAFAVASPALENLQTVNAETAASKVENNYRIELCNFEQWKPDFSLIRLMEGFGKVSRNKDTKYVKSGIYSAKLQPTGGYYSGDNAVMYYPFASTVYEFNYEDFTYVDYVECWVYNDEETVQSMKMGLVSAITGSESIKTYPADTFYLQPKQWNLVTYYIDFAAMSITQTLAANALMQIKGVYFEFNPTGSKEIEDAPVLYMDDLNLYYKEKKNETQIELEDLIAFNHTEGSDVYEVCDFEHVYQKYIFTANVGNIKTSPVFEVVNAKEQNIEGFAATSGRNVLRVTMRGGDAYAGSYTNYELNGAVMRAFYDRFVYDYDTQTPIIPVSEWGNYYLAFDVYAVEGFEEGYFFGQMIYDSEDTTISRSNPAGMSLKNGEWVTRRISLAEIADYTKSRNSTTNASVMAKYEAYKEHFLATGGCGRRISDAGKISFYWPEFVGDTRVMYMDNIRVYKETV